MASPIVMVSSYPPRHCGIATFCEEAREFLRRTNRRRPVLVVSHTDGKGDGVFPVIDISRGDWWTLAARKINELKPYAVHLQHEYGLYEHHDPRGIGDNNQGFLNLLDAIDYPTVVEPHTVHGRLRDSEANFIYGICQRADVVVLKCYYQRWRLHWTFPGYGWETPRNVMVIPHGARPDKRWAVEEVPKLREELGLNKVPGLGEHLVGLVGWIQSNKRWDLLLDMWEEMHDEIKAKTGQEWDILAAGAMRDPDHKDDFEAWVSLTKALEQKGLAHYYEFVPRGDTYYKMMAVCDFVVLPSTDETQSGTLARIIALNKPYITTAPMEGLTAQTLECQGGLLFTNRGMLRKNVMRLACSEDLRMRLGENLKRYLDEEVSWEVVAGQYNEAYRLAHEAKKNGIGLEFPMEF